MIIYNVTVSINADMHADWLSFMRTTHIPEVMATGSFLEYRMCRLLHPEPEDGSLTYAIQYTCDSIKTLDAYTQHHAPTLQQKHHTAFGGGYVAFRSILEIML